MKIINRRFFFIAILTFIVQYSNAQDFSIVNDPGFTPVGSCAVDFADIDGDGDMDALITGRNAQEEFTAFLYKNDGSGDFSKVGGTPFIGIANGSVIFLDVDGDADQDVLIAGAVSTTLRNCTLYINDGKGNFSASSESIFPEIMGGNIIVADVDGDEDQDVFISGVSFESPYYIGALYVNDGSGIFKVKANNFFWTEAGQASAFSDVDGDCDQDLLLLTRSGWSQGMKLFLNDGFGEFELSVSSNFENSHLSNIMVFDLDSDGDQDILVSKSYFIGNSIVRDSFLTYLNDGFGEFTSVAGDLSIKSYRPWKTETGDIDGDGDIDMLFLYFESGKFRTSAFFNDGEGNFSEPLELPSEDHSQGDNALVDIDGDGLLDVFVGGFSYDTGSKVPIVNLYRNEGELFPAQENETDRLEFSIFPNPIEEENLNLNLANNGSCDVNFTIYDSSGRFLSSGNLRPNKVLYQIDISNLSFGVYFLRIENVDKVGIEKFVIN